MRKSTSKNNEIARTDFDLPYSLENIYNKTPIYSVKSIDGKALTNAIDNYVPWYVNKGLMIRVKTMETEIETELTSEFIRIWKENL